MPIDIDPEKDFHVAIDGVVTALSLDALDDAYQADSISEETLIWQEGLDEWMRLDDLLANLGEQGDEEEPNAPAPPVDENRYSVMVAPEEIKTMTLEVLADSHRQGLVNEETLVWQAGYTEWVPLSVVIADVAQQHVSLAPSMPQAIPTASMRATLPGFALAPAPVSTAPVSAAPSNFAPSIAPSAPNSLAPSVASIAPMSQPVGLAASADSLLDDLDFPPIKGAGSPWVKRSLIGLGSLAFVFVIYQGTSDSAGEEAAQLKGVAAAPIPEDEPEPSAWEKEKATMEKARLADEASAKDGSNSATDAFGARLAGEPEAKKNAPARAKRKWRPKAKKASAASKYDPMNGAL